MAPRDVGCGLERYHQFRLLMKKNFLLLWRNKISTVIQILVPIFFIFLLFCLVLAQTSNDSHDPTIGSQRVSVRQDASEVPRCWIGKHQTTCWTVGYTGASDPVVEAIMATWKRQTGFGDNDVIAFATPSASDHFLSNNPNTTQGVYQFVVDYGCANSYSILAVDACLAANHTLDQVIGIKYVVQWNQTAIYNGYNQIDVFNGVYLPMTNTIERAIMETFGNLSYEFSTSPFVHPVIPEVDIVANFGPAVIFAAIMFNLVIQAGMIVTEKELKLRESMRVMGLIDGIYWLSWCVLNVMLNIIAAFLLIAAGCAFQMPLFLKNEFGTYAVLFLLFAVSMVPLGILLSTIVDQASTATTAGFAVFLVGTLIQSFAPIVYSSSTGNGVASFFSLFPFVAFGKGLSDLAKATTNSYQAGLTWADIHTNAWWPLSKTYYFLLIDFPLYLIIALYVDNVRYSKRPWLFPLMPSYWLGTPPKRKLKHTAAKAGAYDVDFTDSDVAAEEAVVLSGQDLSDRGVVLNRLSMTYSSNRYLCCGNVSFRAVKDVCVTLMHGQLFCLLGHNGAGKSTTIGMLTGLLTPTGGEAVILGNSIIDGMDRIREDMGVCPQHDVLWPALTAREHLEIYAGLKKLYGPDMEQEVIDRLQDVTLTAAADTPSGNYSGGMKRRLSVSIALIGDPKIVFLDEPTTGMDPVSRRQVWNLIEKVKRGRITLLTTHSMEEADVLGDRIAIMKGGRLASLGTSLHLKQKYGTGYQVNIISQREQHKKLHQHVTQFFDAPSREVASNKPLPAAPHDPATQNGTKAANGTAKHESTANGKDKTKKKNKPAIEVEPDASEEASSAAYPHGVEDNDNVERITHDGSVSQYRVPLSLHDYLPDFFRSLDGAKKALGISNVQLQMTTLEDVFLRVAEQDEVVETKKKATKQERAKRQRRRCCQVFWVLWVLAAIVGASVALGLAFTKHTPGVPPTPTRSAEPSPFVPFSGSLDLSTFPSALQVTDVTTFSALISAYVTTSATVTLNLLQANGSTNWVDVQPTPFKRGLVLTPNSLQRVQTSLSNLQPDTAYSVYLQTSSGNISEVTRFRTATAYGPPVRNITLVATSAFGLSDYPYQSLSCGYSYNADAFLLLGDLVYGKKGQSVESRISDYNHLLTSSGFRNITQTTSFIATWNDLEVWQGWKQNHSDANLQANVNAAIQARDYTFPHVGGPGGAIGSVQYSSLWRSISWGQNVEIFVLDLQYERTETQLMSDEQLQWLMNGLNNSVAQFKVVMSSIPLTDTSPVLIAMTNSWAVSPEAYVQRSILTEWITNNTIEGVLFISGGALFGMTAQANPSPVSNPPAWSSYNITESTVGPVGTFINPQVLLSSNLAYSSDQFHGISDSYSTTVFNFDPRTGWFDVHYLDDQCLLAYSDSFRIASPL